MDSITNLKLNVFVYMTVYFFFCGADAYIMLPTAWYYIRSLGQSKSFYGAVLASQAIGFILLSSIVGKLADKTRRVRLILLTCLTTKVIAYLVYAIPVSAYCPLVGFFFSGAANSGYGVMYGEIIRYTSNVSRSKLFLLVDSMFVVGASCGPVFGSVVTFKANILGWNIDYGNSPGILLAVVWFVMLCVLIFLPSDFGTEEIDLKDDNEDELLEDSLKLNTGLIKILNSSSCCLYYLNFTNCLLQSVFVALSPLLAMELFHWKLLDVKMLFGTGMMFSFVIFLVSYIATAYYSDRNLVVFTVVLQLPSLPILIFYAIFWKDAPYFISYLLIIYVSFGMSQAPYPFLSVLLSKIISTQHASTVQNLLLIFGNIGHTAGRLGSGIMFAETRLVGFSVGLAAIWVVGIVWFVLIFSRFAPNTLTDQICTRKAP